MGDAFLAAVRQRCFLPNRPLRGTVGGLLARLNRTGLYETFTGRFFDYAGGQGTLTPLFDRLLDLLEWEVSSS